MHIREENCAVLLALDPQHFPTLQNARQVLVQGEKHPENPVLRPRPGEWDGTRCKVYGTVLYDAEARSFRMWYSGGTDTPDAIRRERGAHRHLGYAVSSDGVHWERPALGLVEYNGTTRNNLILLDAQAPVVYKQDDADDPGRRYLMITEYGQGTHRIRTLYSPDGLRWTESQKEQAKTQTKWGTHEPFSILYDPADPDPARRWKGYSLLHMRQNGYRGRAVGLYFAAEPEAWVEHPTQPIMSPVDGMESEIHIPHVTRFYDSYVMLFDAMEPNHHTQTEIAISDDALHFRRVQNGVKLLPNGKPGQPDAGKICVSPRSLFVHDGKIWWYYTMSTDTYQTAPRSNYPAPWYRYTGLAQWRLDGFACLCVAVAGQEAVVESKPVTVTAAGVADVWLNAVAPRGDGSITVELLNEAGRVLAMSEPWSGDLLRGEVRWQGTAPALAAGQTVVLRCRIRGIRTRLYALGLRQARYAPATGVTAPPAGRADARVRWTARADAKITATPALDGDTVFAGSWDQHLYAFDAQTGSVRWRAETGNAITTAPVLHGATVFTGSRDGHIYAFDKATGALRWKTLLQLPASRMATGPNGDWIDGSPAIGAWTPRWQDETEAPQRLFVGTHGRHLHALDLEQGREWWRFPTYNWILSRPAVDGYTVYFGAMDGHIYALDANCGALRWSYRAGQHLRYAPTVAAGSIACEAVCGSPLVANGTVFCGADDGFVYALDADSGRERWVYQTDRWVWGRPLLAGSVLVVASADSRVYGLDAASGQRIWRLTTANANYADVVAYDGLALVACTSGTLYALEPHTGHVRWTFDAGAGLRAAPAVGPDGSIYLPTCSGALHAIRPAA